MLDFRLLRNYLYDLISDTYVKSEGWVKLRRQLLKATTSVDTEIKFIKYDIFPLFDGFLILLFSAA